MENDYGKIAYVAYCTVSGGQSLVSGATLPPWDGLSDPIREAWKAAGNAAAIAALRTVTPEPVPPVRAPGNELPAE